MGQILELWDSHSWEQLLPQIPEWDGEWIQNSLGFLSKVSPGGHSRAQLCSHQPRAARAALPASENNEKATPEKKVAEKMFSLGGNECQVPFHCCLFALERG